MREKIDNENLLFSNRALTALLVPLMIEQLLAVLVGMTDSVMVSSVGEAAVSGVSLVDGVMILLINAFSALATGGAVIAGQYLGQKKTERAVEGANQLVVFIALSSVGIMALLYLARGFFLNVVFGQIERDVYGYANTYFLIVTASVPFIAIYNAGAAIFRSMGNSRVTMAVSFVMNLMNVCGNAALIYGLHMDTAGAAIPTLVSRAAAAFIIMALLRRRDRLLHLEGRFCLQINPEMIRKILYFGVPNGLENSMFQLGRLMVLSLVSTFGTYAITANAVCNAIAPLQTLPGTATGLAMTTVISRCVGANDYRQVRFYTRRLMAVSYIGMTAVGLLMFLLLPWMIKIYNLTDQTAEEVTRIMILHTVSAIVCWSAAFVLPAVFRAAGDVRFTMMVSIISMWVCRIGMSYVFGLYLHGGVFAVWVAMALDWTVRVALFLWRYRGTRWIRRAVD